MIFSLSDIQFQIFVHKYHSSKIILKKFENNCVLEILDWLCITLKEKRLIEILNGLDFEIQWVGERWDVQQ